MHLNSVKYFLVLFFFIIVLLFPNDIFAQINHSASTQIISANTTYYDSGGNGSNYSNGENAALILEPFNSGEYISVSFTSFNVEEDYDYLYVFNGTDPSDAISLIGIYTGNRLPENIISSDATGALSFVFTSDAGTTQIGWEATITTTTSSGNHPSQVTHPQSDSEIIEINCGSPLIYTDSGSESNYGSGENGVITFKPSSLGKYISVVFDRNSFDVEKKSNTECWDYINVYDGTDVNATFLGSFCNNDNLPGSFTSSDISGALTFKFYSDENTEYSGWEACVICSDMPGINRIVQPASGNLTKVIECGQEYTFYDPGIEEDYPDGQSSTLTICPSSSGNVIHFNITDVGYSTVCLNYGGDYLNVYDGDNTSADLVYHYHQCSDPVVPFTATTSSGCLTFEFYSNNDTYNDYGWKADIWCGSLLPIELINFDAKQLANNKVEFNWITQSEINNNFFTIEKSIDGVEFVPTLTKKGAGNSSKVLNYTIIDSDFIDKITYYRLKQTDFNGAFSYSEIVAIAPKVLNSKVEVYPNPILDTYTLDICLLNLQRIELQIIDISGRLVCTEEFEIQEENISKTFNRNSIKNGIYYLIILDKENNIVIDKKKIVFN